MNFTLGGLSRNDISPKQNLAESVTSSKPSISNLSKNDLSVIVDTSKKLNFFGRLESYLYGYRKGRPDRSSSIPYELQSRDYTTSDKLLENGGVRAFTDYNRYSTAFNGYEKARYVAGVSEGTSILDKIF